MHFQTIATLAAAAVAATATSVNAAECNTNAIASLLASDDVTTCSTESGYKFTSLSTPTDAQITSMCGDQACLSALAALKALNLGDCTVANFAIMTDLVEPIVSSCNDTSTSGAATTTTASSGSGATETTVGESSTTGSDDTVETTAPAASSGSEESTETPSAASASSAASAGSVGSSGSNSGAALTATSALVSSVVLAAAMMA